jgi:hypothetical protein
MPVAPATGAALFGTRVDHAPAVRRSSRCSCGPLTLRKTSPDEVSTAAPKLSIRKPVNESPCCTSFSMRAPFQRYCAQPLPHAWKMTCPAGVTEGPVR